MADISAILTGHREGLLIGPSMASFREAILEANALDINVEPIVILDRADKLTASTVLAANTFGARIVHTDCGDPGQSRNAGVEESNGTYVTFLDGDDLWSFNWLSAAFKFCEAADKMTIAHSQAIVAFGRESHVWMHRDSSSADCDLGYLALSNYWDALCFAPRETLNKIPFKKNDLPNGAGHEDWHWNNVTILEGYSHRPVPDTVHFKRKRANSQMALCASSDALPWLTEISSFSVADALNARREVTKSLDSNKKYKIKEG